MSILVFIQFLKAMVCEAAAFTVIFRALLSRGDGRKHLKWVTVALVVLAVLSIPLYLDLGQYPKHGRFFNPHDWFHYYLGAKYSEELGYRNIYRAVIVANTENNGKLIYDSARSQDDYNYESAKAIMGRADQYKAPFTPGRWTDFRKDVAYFQSITKPSRWPNVVKDKGYNATPPWNMVAGIIINTIGPTDSPAGMWLLQRLDFMLLGAMLLLVYWAFGLHAMLLMAIFFGCHYCMSFPHIRGALLRMDWVTCIVMGACLLKKGWHKTAGAVLAYGALMRMFPVVFAFGMGAKMLWEIYDKRRLDRRFVHFFGAFTLTIAVMLAGTVLYDGGTDHWKDFFAKISMHDEDISTVRVGFKYIFVGASSVPATGWRAFETGAQEYLENHKINWWAIQLIIIGICAFLSRKAEDYETVPLGYVLAFFLTAPTFYYHVMLIVPFVIFIAKMDRPFHAAGVAVMFLLCCAWYALLQFWRMEDMSLSYTLAWSILGLCLLVLIAALRTGPPIAGELVQAGAMNQVEPNPERSDSSPTTKAGKSPRSKKRK